jgi:creatinine amidohydrolase
MLCAFPDGVRMERAEDFGSAHLHWRQAHPDLGLGTAALRPGWLMEDLNPRGAVGNAAAATAQKGRMLLDTAARNLAQLVVEFRRFG